MRLYLHGTPPRRRQPAWRAALGVLLGAMLLLAGFGDDANLTTAEGILLGATLVAVAFVGWLDGRAAR